LTTRREEELTTGGEELTTEGKELTGGED